MKLSVCGFQPARRGTYATFLQGSYRNNTAIADINDVDIVALQSGDRAPQSSGSWSYDFSRLVELLSPRWTVKRGDKCIKVSGVVDADVVPAIRGNSNPKNDPVVVYSRSEALEVSNFPRAHIGNGELKQAINGNYKATVRLLKRWARQYKGTVEIPSFYLESAVYQVPDSEFSSDRPISFASVGLTILSWEYSTKVVRTVAGDKDILVPSEWARADYDAFKSKLHRDIKIVISAIKAPTRAEADKKWKLAFGE